MKFARHLLVLGSLVLASFASAAERVALVIGNNAYQHGAPLKNCVNDARAVSAGLKDCGFAVTLVEDATLQEMEAKVREFKRAATGAQAAWFFYAGHGAEVAGVNYLIPVNANVEDEHEVKHKTLALDQLLGAMDGAGAPLKVVVLDCCRDNPFGRGWGRSKATGLAHVSSTPKGTIIAYATSPGKVAADGKGNNSPYTTALVSALAKPGLEIDAVFRETGRQVQEMTKETQNPWLSISFYGNFVMRTGANAQAKIRAGEAQTLRLPGGVEMTLCYCPPGSFTMGSPETEKDREGSENQVQVQISQGFWMARTETTQAQWEAVMGNNPSYFKGAQLPVETVRWEDAHKFVTQLNSSGIQPAGWKWSLPTEAQWEYACRAGTSSAFSSGGESFSSQHANFDGNYPYGQSSIGPNLDKTIKVGSYTANAWGLHDMHGNVEEWCSDWRHVPWYESKLEGGVDPVGPETGVNRMIRGGAFNTYGRECRSAARKSRAAEVRFGNLGFRPVLVPAR